MEPGYEQTIIRCCLFGLLFIFVIIQFIQNQKRNAKNKSNRRRS